MLKQKKINIKEQMRCFLDKHPRWQNIIDIAIAITFFALFFSIPTMSFNSKLYFITWGLSIILLLLIAVTFILFNKIRIDLIIISYVLFCISALISCAFTGFITFNYTYFLLTFFIIAIYEYTKCNRRMIKILLYSMYFANIVFLCLFYIVYNKDIFLFGSTRLGEFFGDINDTAIFNGIGATFAFYFAFFAKRHFMKIINIILLLFFGLAILSSGSKIAYLFVPIVLFVCIFLKLGMKRIWISLLIISGVVLILILLVFLPPFQFIGEKIVSMVGTIIPIPGVSDAASTDQSTLNRLNMIMVALEMFMRKPLFGFGVNGFQYFGGLTDGVAWSHNHFAEMLSGTGILGFAFYNMPIFYCLYHAIKDKKRISSIFFIFYIVSMISIVLCNEKLFAFPAGIFFAQSTKLKDVLVINLFPNLKKKMGVMNEANDDIYISDKIIHRRINI